MILIIAEKPSLGRNITAAIGGMTKRDGYFEGGNYIVTWAFGHLFSLSDIEKYNPNSDGSTRWSMANLPCFPKKYMFELRKGNDKKVDSGVIKQFDTIKSLCNRADVDTIVNAGDSDREGEIIIRIIVDHAFQTKEQKTTKVQKRLWLPDQTAETINKGLAEMKSENEYDNLAYEGYARTFVDWLYGVNLTRYATLKTGALLRVGRVIVPIVKAVYDRDMAIKNFVTDIYYAIVSNARTNGEEIELQSKQKFEKSELSKAQSLCNQYNACEAVVTEVKRKKDKLNPGKLYSLTKLQNMLGKKYKMSMADSLAIVQKLYEEGYVTYPRTNSEYLATAEKDKVKKILEAVGKMGYPVEFKDSKSIFDDSKIESHSALTPTFKIPSKDRFTSDEANVYGTIIRRFVAVFCADPCLAEKTEIKIDVGGLEQFSLKGTVILEKGWTKYDDYKAKDKVLPKLSKGDRVTINFNPMEKETNPPRHYTIETLNNYLKNPFKEDKAAISDSENDDAINDDADYKAIFDGLELGTEATRTGIIDNARKSKYIELKKDVYTILPDGIYLIESLARMKIGMDKYKTAELGRSLKKVYRNECKINDCILLAQQEISEVFGRNETETALERDTDDGFYGDVAGKCPLCGGDVVRTKFGYGCNKYKDGCKFSLNGVICGRVISINNVKKLLTDGKTSKIVGFTSKNGKTFDAALRLEGDRTIFDFS
ncbi:MAG: DNA topoisomerase [Oscillospiraceae bacterium]